MAFMLKRLAKLWPPFQHEKKMGTQAKRISRGSSLSFLSKLFSPMGISYGLILPAMFGYYLWGLVLTGPMVHFSNSAERTFDFPATITGTGWFQQNLTNISVSPIETVQYIVQGIFLRGGGKSMAILSPAGGGATEVIIEGQTSQNGLTLISAKATEVEIRDTSGQTMIVKMVSAKTLSSLYAPATSNPAILGAKAYDDGGIKLRPINSAPQANHDTPQKNRNNNSVATNIPPTEADALGTMSLLNNHPRFRHLNNEQQDQIRNMMATPQFSEAVRDNPDILEQLIDSLPTNVKN